MIVLNLVVNGGPTIVNAANPLQDEAFDCKSPYIIESSASFLTAPGDTFRTWGNVTFRMPKYVDGALYVWSALVATGARFETVDSTAASGTKLWKGLKVGPGATLRLKNCSIRNGDISISNWDEAQPMHVLEIDGCDFTANDADIGVWFNPTLNPEARIVNSTFRALRGIGIGIKSPSISVTGYAWIADNQLTSTSPTNTHSIEVTGGWRGGLVRNRFKVNTGTTGSVAVRLSRWMTYASPACTLAGNYFTIIGANRYAVEAPADPSRQITATCNDWGKYTAGEIEPLIIHKNGRAEVFYRPFVGETGCSAPPSGGGGGTGCPFVLSRVNGEYVVENSILGRSELQARSAEELIWDAYPLEMARVDADGRVRIRIAELESDTDRMDYVGLSAIRAPEGSRVGVDEDGSPVVYQPSSIANALVTWTGKALPFVSPVSPGDAYQGEPGDSMDISLGGWPVTRGKVVLHLIPKPVESSPLPGRTPGLEIRVSPDESGDRWTTLGPVVPREYWSDALVSLDGIGGAARRIRLVWNTRHTLGSVGLAEPLENIEQIDLTPVSALHSSGKDVLNDIGARDQREVVLRPGESIDLEFDGSKVPVGTRLVLRAHGRYSRVGQAAKSPTATFSLGQNRPNPFNPETEISFFLPVGCDVSLRVFDVAGRQVRQLVRGSEAAGRHSVSWDGRDEQGRSLSSGVYFYELQAGSFQERRRLVILR